MSTIETKIYTFDELSDEAKQKAREWYLEGVDSNFTWDTTQEDAAQIGLKIISLDQHRPNKGIFKGSAPETAELIIANHGEACETHKLARSYLAERTERPSDSDEDADDSEWEDQSEEQDSEFLRALLEAYYRIFERDIEYQASNECVDENIRINEYEFTEDGRII